ncbi:MAG: hypothetical protein WKG06_07940 [Segetibacter sp.]
MKQEIINLCFLALHPVRLSQYLKASKAIAVMNGREFVTPDDVKKVLPSVLRHRIILTPEKEMEGSTPDEIIRSDC